MIRGSIKVDRQDFQLDVLSSTLQPWLLTCCCCAALTTLLQVEEQVSLLWCGSETPALPPLPRPEHVLTHAASALRLLATANPWTQLLQQPLAEAAVMRPAISCWPINGVIAEREWWTVRGEEGFAASTVSISLEPISWFPPLWSVGPQPSACVIQRGENILLYRLNAAQIYSLCGCPGNLNYNLCP